MLSPSMFVLGPVLIITNIFGSVSEVGGEGVLLAVVCEQVCTMTRFDHDQYFEECVTGGRRKGAISER